jgi:hypothetical protein
MPPHRRKINGREISEDIRSATWQSEIWDKYGLSREQLYDRVIPKLVQAGFLTQDESACFKHHPDEFPHLDKLAKDIRSTRWQSRVWQENDLTERRLLEILVPKLVQKNLLTPREAEVFLSLPKERPQPGTKGKVAPQPPGPDRQAVARLKSAEGKFRWGFIGSVLVVVSSLASFGVYGWIDSLFGYQDYAAYLWWVGLGALWVYPTVFFSRFLLVSKGQTLLYAILCFLPVVWLIPFLNLWNVYRKAVKALEVGTTPSGVIALDTNRGKSPPPPKDYRQVEGSNESTFSKIVQVLGTIAMMSTVGWTVWQSPTWKISVGLIAEFAACMAAPLLLLFLLLFLIGKIRGKAVGKRIYEVFALVCLWVAIAYIADRMGLISAKGTWNNLLLLTRH